MLDVFETSDGWALWFVDGVPVTWSRCLGDGWVVIYRYRLGVLPPGAAYPEHIAS